MQPEVDRFLKYATPRINYIYEQDFDGMTKEAAPLWLLKFLAKSRKALNLGRRAVPVVPNKGLEGVAKAVRDSAATRHAAQTAKRVAEANALAAAGKAPGAFTAVGKNLGLNFLKGLYDWTVDIPADMIKRIGRWMGANGKIVDGKFIRGVASRGDNLGSKIYDFGYNLRNNILRGSKIDSALRASQKNMILAGIDPAHAKTIGRIGKIGGGGAVLGLGMAPAFLPEDHPLSVAGNVVSLPFEYFHPLGIGMKAVGWGMDKMKQTAFDSAAQAAYQTQDQIMQGLQDSGRMGHIGGLISPEFYANQARQKVMDAMKQQFAEQAAGLGVKNTFEQLVNQYQNNVQ